ncbi:hypothetical protein SDJN03_13748, partial [Cucurbita argyrosperma subsp. sororia]
MDTSFQLHGRGAEQGTGIFQPFILVRLQFGIWDNRSSYALQEEKQKQRAIGFFHSEVGPFELPAASAASASASASAVSKI